MQTQRGTRSERGVVAVEFALVMVPLLALVFGAIQYGLYFWSSQGGSDIVRSAVRDSAVGDPATTTCSAFKSAIRDQINSLAGDGATATITRTYIDAQSPPDGLTVGDKVQISVQFKSVNMHFPFVPFVHDGLVTSSATARVDYVPDPDHPSQGCP